MSEKPILFNTEMVMAILEGRKTVTRRIVKGYILNDARWGYTTFTPKGHISCRGNNGEEFYKLPYEKFYKLPCEKDDILYVRENWAKIPGASSKGGYAYKYKASTEGEYWEKTAGWKWKPSIHMPKEAARIWLKVTDVRVERLNDITKEQAGREGVTWETDNSGLMRISQFIKLWNSTLKKSDYDKYCWNANPWVWVIEFERYEKAEANNEVGNTTRNV